MLGQKTNRDIMLMLTTSSQTIAKPLVGGSTSCIVSFSGGQSSALMGAFICEQFYNRIGKDIHFFFADTGQEMPETYQFINDFEKHFNIKIEKRKKDLIELIENTGYLPNRMMRYCTSRIKEHPAKKYAVELGYKPNDYVSALGLRFDEPLRVARMKDKYFLPLHYGKITKQDVNNYWDAMPFKLNIPNYKGNCKFCFLKSLPKLIALAKEYPKEFYEWVLIEEKYKRGKHGFRQDISFRSIYELSQQKSLFDFVDSPNEEIACSCTD
jgi:3'-phosphoadenosine 5'-phosphosulfate sulfotransferase (PAPS reductase)/FAD synthetase